MNINNMEKEIKIVQFKTLTHSNVIILLNNGKVYRKDSNDYWTEEPWLDDLNKYLEKTHKHPKTTQ